MFTQASIVVVTLLGLMISLGLQLPHQLYNNIININDTFPTPLFNDTLLDSSSWDEDFPEQGVCPIIFDDLISDCNKIKQIMEWAKNVGYVNDQGKESHKLLDRLKLCCRTSSGTCSGEEFNAALYDQFEEYELADVQ